MQNTSNLHLPATEKNLWGWINGFIGVVIFSASLPATRVAVQAFEPVFLTFARASIAGYWPYAFWRCSMPSARIEVNFYRC